MQQQIAQQPKPDGCDKPGNGWVLVYPIYINADKKCSEGRKVPLSHACRWPSCPEIEEVCIHFKLPFHTEKHKAHPRENIQKLGRVRVRLKDDEGQCVWLDCT